MKAVSFKNNVEIIDLNKKLEYISDGPKIGKCSCKNI